MIHALQPLPCHPKRHRSAGLSCGRHVGAVKSQEPITILCRFILLHSQYKKCAMTPSNRPWNTRCESAEEGSITANFTLADRRTQHFNSTITSQMQTADQGGKRVKA